MQHSHGSVALSKAFRRECGFDTRTQHSNGSAAFSGECGFHRSAAFSGKRGFHKGVWLSQSGTTITLECSILRGVRLSLEYGFHWSAAFSGECGIHRSAAFSRRSVAFTGVQHSQGRNVAFTGVQHFQGSAAFTGVQHSQGSATLYTRAQHSYEVQHFYNDVRHDRNYTLMNVSSFIHKYKI